MMVLGWTVSATTRLAAQTVPDWDVPADTVVVYNSDLPESQELAKYYAEQRGIASERLIGLKCPPGDSMSRQEFEELLRKPLYDLFKRAGWWSMEERPTKDARTGKSTKGPVVVDSKVRLIVLMRGIPFQIRREAQSPKSTEEDEASVDSELTLLGMVRQPVNGALRNPYFDLPTRFRMLQNSNGLLLVGRLDGPDAATVKRMIDDSIKAEETGLRGRAAVDLALRTGVYEEGEEWLRRTTKTFREFGIPTYVDRHESVMRENWPLPDTALYFGWYTSDACGALKPATFRFAPGAIACHLHSFSGAELRAADKHWVGPLLSMGAAAVMGNVFEPYLSLTVHFDVFTKRLMEGYTLAEAAWNATPALSWMNVVVGDPLYRPYGKPPGSAVGGEGRDRDYALYQGSVVHFGVEDTRPIKSMLTEMAEERNRPHLLELTALLSDVESKTSEAIELMEHAAALYPEAADKLRTTLYLADMYRREGNVEAAKKLLKNALQNTAFKDLPGLAAARAMLAE